MAAILPREWTGFSSFSEETSMQFCGFGCAILYMLLVLRGMICAGRGIKTIFVGTYVTTARKRPNQSPA
jgi:hypothetical protein